MLTHRTTIVGHLGADPEMRFTPSGVAVANFNVAVTEKWTSKGTGEKQEKTTWYTVTAWRESAEMVTKYLTKGSKVMVEGQMQPPKCWIDGNTNEPRARLELNMQDITFLGGGTQQQNTNGGGTQHRQGQAPARQAAPQSFNDGPMDEDIPF